MPLRIHQRLIMQTTTKKPFTHITLYHGMKLRVTMERSVKGDDSLPEYVGIRHKLEGKSVDFVNPEGIARRFYRNFEKGGLMNGATMRYKAMYTREGVIGFLAYTKAPMPVLHAFCIHKDYRTDEIKAGFLRFLDEIFDGMPYSILLHKKNVRAIRFFERNGYRQTERIRHNSMVFLCKHHS